MHVVRYADDFIVTSSTKELLETKVMPWIEEFLKVRGLNLSQEKTKITHINEGFDFLGQNIRKYKGKLLIKPSKRNKTAFLHKVRSIIKEHKQAKAGDLITYLNPVIRGWVNYHQYVVSSKTFSSIDRAIFHTLWRWCLRRHPNKSKRWVKQKYFATLRNNNWTFHGESIDNQGKLVKHWLLRASNTPIKRHIKIQGAANPYAREWKTYFLHREAKQSKRVTSVHSRVSS